MSVVDFLKKKFMKIKSRFYVQKVPIMLKKDVETMAYLSKI